MPDTGQTVPSRAYGAAFALLAILAMLWGIGHRFYETLMPQFAAVFDLRGARHALTDSAYQIVYIIGAIPAALIARRLGYKATLLCGLGSICIGAFTFYPAAETQGFSYFVGATVLLAFGWIILEICTNPLAMAFGSQDHAVRRLNLIQTAYPAGSLIGIFSARWLIDANLALPAEANAYSFSHPYIALGIGVLLIAFLIEETRFPPIATERASGFGGLRDDLRALLAHPLFGYAVLAQFANILAMALCWVVAGRAFAEAFPMLTGTEVASIFVWCLTLLGIGRFAAAALMWLQSPARVLELFAAGGVLTALAGIALGGAIAAFASLALCFFLAPAWPTIFGLGVNGLGPRMKLAAAPITMGGALGAVLARFLSGMSDRSLMAVIVLALAAMLAFALRAAKATPDHA